MHYFGTKSTLNELVSSSIACNRQSFIDIMEDYKCNVCKN